MPSTSIVLILGLLLSSSTRAFVETNRVHIRRFDAPASPASARFNSVGGRFLRVCSAASSLTLPTDSDDKATIVVNDDTRCVSVPSASTDTSWPPNHPNFFDEQLGICRLICEEASTHDNLFNARTVPTDRSRFKEHPRCTARFGEVLLHARNSASSSEEYQLAVFNAQSVLNYVDGCIQSNARYPIRYGLIEDVANALQCTAIRKFRAKQISADTCTPSPTQSADERPKSDFIAEQSDLEILGRLYYSAVSYSDHCLREVGLTSDHCGFTVLLALCRAVSASTRDPSCTSMLCKDGTKLDAALSNHFNGLTTPGCRFLFSPRHGVPSKKIGVTNCRSKHLIIAFSSLGNGLVRHEFGGSLAKLNKDLEEPFDVLFVADPAQSWYQKESRGHFNGFEEYEKRIGVASRSYRRISIVGDSMGGSAALLFSHLATDAVVSFSPQIELNGDCHVSRDDMTTNIRDGFRIRLFHSVDDGVEKGVKIAVHRGVEESDVKHTDTLLSGIAHSSRRGVQIVEHEGCKHHQIAVYLKEKGELMHVLACMLL